MCTCFKFTGDWWTACRQGRARTRGIADNDPVSVRSGTPQSRTKSFGRRYFPHLPWGRCHVVQLRGGWLQGRWRHLCMWWGGIHIPEIDAPRGHHPTHCILFTICGHELLPDCLYYYYFKLEIVWVSSYNWLHNVKCRMLIRVLFIVVSQFEVGDRIQYLSKHWT